MILPFFIKDAETITRLGKRRKMAFLTKSALETNNIASQHFSKIELAELIENGLYSVNANDETRNYEFSAKESVSSSLDMIHSAMNNPDGVSGISTGLIDLDNLLSGFHKSDLIVIGDRPGRGKTAFALHFLLSVCNYLKKQKDEAKPQAVGFFSLEMSQSQLSLRLLSTKSKISGDLLRSGKIKEEQYNNLRKFATELESLPFFIDETPSFTISTLSLKARRMKRKHNIGMLIIDYLQLIKGTKKTETSKVNEITEVSNGLKALARELDIPIIALAQLSRNVEQRDDKRPMLSDLRESGSIEQDADVVMFLYREEYYLKAKEPDRSNPKHQE